MNAKKLLFACGMGRKYGKYKLYGYTKKYNQLVRNGNFADESGWNVYSGTGSVSNNTLNIVGAIGRNGVKIQTQFILKQGKYLIRFKYKSNVRLQSLFATSIYSQTQLLASDDFVSVNEVINITNDSTYLILDIFPNTSGEVGNFSLKDIMVHDLTQDQNETLTLEQALAYYGTSYLTYTGEKGALMKADLKGAEFRGRNEFDGVLENGSISLVNGNNTSVSGVVRTKNYVSVEKDKSYYFARSGTDQCYILFYDENKNYLGNSETIRTETKTFTFSTYYSNVAFIRCIIANTDLTQKVLLQLSTYTDTTYAPYISPIISQVDVQLGGNHEVDLVSLLGKQNVGSTIVFNNDLTSGKFAIPQTNNAFVGSGYSAKSNNDKTIPIIKDHTYYCFIKTKNIFSINTYRYYIYDKEHATFITVFELDKTNDNKLSGKYKANFNSNATNIVFNLNTYNGIETIDIEYQLIIDLTDIGLDGLTAQQFYDKYHTEFDKLANGERVSIGWADEWFNWTGLTNRKSGDVDLDTISVWSWSSWYKHNPNLKTKSGVGALELANLIASKYQTSTYNYAYNHREIEQITCEASNGLIAILTGDVSINPTGYLSYELATPTTQNNPSLYLPLGITKCTDKYGHEIEIVAVD